jgi:hypothetical protein
MQQGAGMSSHNTEVMQALWLQAVFVNTCTATAFLLMQADMTVISYNC